MRTAGLFVALGATLNIAFAEVICNPEALHHVPKVITATEKAAYANSIDKLCSAGKTNTVIEDRSGSTVFTITSTDDIPEEIDCKAQFNSIINDCIIGKNIGGGIVVAGRTILDILIDTNSGKALESETPASKWKRATKKPAAKKPAAKKPAAKKPAAKKPSKTNPSGGKPVASPSKPSPTPKPAKPPAGRACALKPGKGKKNTRQVLRDLVSKILRRAGPGSPAGSMDSCPDEPMATLPGWGKGTFFGSRSEIGITAKDLVAIAKESYNQITAKHPGLTILVAALYVPNKGVYLGTVVHDDGEAKMKAEAPISAPVLWEVLSERETIDPKKSQTLFHAEDAAMWYAYKKGAVTKTSKFPQGSIITTWGKIPGGGQATYIEPCSESTGSNIRENCKKTLSILGPRPVK
ncbi:hypothetical protein EKO04_005085 [Ascochyta lentis]|uniref:Uncharacterized protein n=1 Tax=Ascochyta lentis TaxID=205686 RepID=A0A8H7MJH4_9PLEO|nr:hypothetical protein EKO04_005085 [Ascochyta lentis]